MWIIVTVVKLNIIIKKLPIYNNLKPKNSTKAKITEIYAFETYGTNYPFMKTHGAIIECGVVVRIFFRLFY